MTQSIAREQSMDHPEVGRHRREAYLGLCCIAAAVVSGLLKGVWELVWPMLASPDVWAAKPSGQRLLYASLEVIKSAGFMAGLVGLYRLATKRGRITTAFLILAGVGSVVFASVWVAIAITGGFTLIYVLGGMWYQMVAPVALGIAAVQAHKVARWVGVWAIVVGVVNSQIFALLGPGWALVVQGVVWAALGYGVWYAAMSSRGHG